jgi:hypothetical protein
MMNPVVHRMSLHHLRDQKLVDERVVVRVHLDVVVPGLRKDVKLLCARPCRGELACMRRGNDSVALGSDDQRGCGRA